MDVQKKKLDSILKTLDQRYGTEKEGFLHEEEWQLLAAIMLSAQSTDKQVDEALPGLFSRFKKAEDVAEASQEEIEGYLIIKAILCSVVDPARVVMRDRQTYCGILLDENNRKPLCRMHFNSVSVKYIGTFDADKNETKHKIEKLDDIYQYADLLRTTVGYYLGEQ